MEALNSRLGQQFSSAREQLRSMLAEHGYVPISTVNVSQLIGGMRGVGCLVCDTSSVDAQSGLSIRGYPIHDLKGRSPEEVFWLLLTGEFATAQELQALQAELAERRRLPAYVDDLLAAMPADSHPMPMFSAALLAMQHESRLHAQYGRTTREDLWKPALEDALDLFSRLPLLASAVYRHCYGGHGRAAASADPFVRQLACGLLGDGGAALEDLLRAYVIVQSDHESGNVCALATHITGSTHADPYLALSSGANGLAGHIHGLAAQDFVSFLLELERELGAAADRQAILARLRQLMDSGRVIPGFGHAVLRSPDPRFQILKEYGDQQLAAEPLFRLASELYSAGTEVLSCHAKVRNPYPNVDAITGVVLYLSGIRQLEFFTVLFSCSLSIGLLAQYVVSRGMQYPIVRPRSVSLAELHSLCAQSGQ